MKQITRHIVFGIVLLCAVFMFTGCNFGPGVETGSSATGADASSRKTIVPWPKILGYFYIRCRWEPRGYAEYLRVRDGRKEVFCEGYDGGNLDYYKWLIFQNQDGSLFIKNRAVTSFTLCDSDPAKYFHRASNTLTNYAVGKTPDNNNYLWRYVTNGEGFKLIQNVATGDYLNTELHSYYGESAAYLQKNVSDWWSAQWIVEQ
jgi:hypothetical protein